MEEELQLHIPGMFKPGDTVVIKNVIKSAKAWYPESSPSAAPTGSIFTVYYMSDTSGYRLSDNCDYPSCALELVKRPDAAATQRPQATANPKLTRKKAAKQDQGTKPWDAAPCTHLRWNMMGLLKEKLKMCATEVLQADGTPLLSRGYEGKPGGVVTIRMRCVKCSKEMAYIIPVEKS